MARFDGTGPKKKREAGLQSFRDDQQYREALMFGPNAASLDPATREALKEYQAFDATPEGRASIRDNDNAYMPWVDDSGEDLQAGGLNNPYASGHVVNMPSGHVGYEVSDAHREVTVPETGSAGVMLPDIFPNSQDLFEAYPQLAQVPVTIGDLGEGTFGYATPPSEFNPNMEFAINPAMGETRETAIHEVQHLIDFLEDRPANTWIPHSQAEAASGAGDHFRTESRSEIAENWDKIYDHYFGQYMNEQSEDMARGIEKRLDMTPEQLRDTPPREHMNPNALSSLDELDTTLMDIWDDYNAGTMSAEQEAAFIELLNKAGVN